MCGVKLDLSKLFFYSFVFVVPGNPTQGLVHSTTDFTSSPQTSFKKNECLILVV